MADDVAKGREASGAHAAPHGAPQAYTFVCLGEKQVATTLDLQALPPQGYRAHAIGLLRAHASATAVEVWSDEAMIEVIDRGGVRVWPAPEDDADAT